MYWKMWVFQMTQELVRGTSNLLVAKMYWMIAFKIHVFDASFCLKKHQIEVTLRFGNHGYHEYFL